MPASKKTTNKAAHRITADIRALLTSNPNVKKQWDTLTPLARGEWICYVTIVKKPETRKKRLDRLREDLLAGKRRPCCWPGCPHRRESAKKWF